MRLFEIESDISFYARPLAGKVNPSIKHKLTQPKGLEHLGSGVATTVYQKKTQPHEVKKITFHVVDFYESYLFEFLKVCIEHQGNPFFPKIYSVQVLRERDHGYFAVYVTMEKLHQLEDLTWGEISFLYRKLFDISVKKATELRAIRDKEDAIIFLARLVKTQVDKIHGLNVPAYGVKPSPQLEMALRELGSILKKVPGAFADIHKDNIMFRRTPYGVQLVLSDPVHRYSDID